MRLMEFDRAMEYVTRRMEWALMVPIFSIRVIRALRTWVRSLLSVSCRGTEADDEMVYDLGPLREVKMQVIKTDSNIYQP